MAKDKTASELEQMKEKVDEAEKKVNTLQGKQDSLLEQLSNEFGLNSVEEAETELERLKKESKKLEDQVSQKIEEIKENYDL